MSILLNKGDNMNKLKLKTKKGFSLIELLVVIAIIGVLSAVGITTYSGYTANAKVQAAKAQYSSVVSLLNAEEAKCASGSGTFVWGEACGTRTLATVVTYFNTTLGMKSTYNPSGVAVKGLASATAALVVADDKGKTGIFANGGAWTIRTDTTGNGVIDTEITTTAY